jgi:hypothetical protein
VVAWLVVLMQDEGGSHLSSMQRARECVRRTHFVTHSRAVRRRTTGR